MDVNILNQFLLHWVHCQNLVTFTRSKCVCVCVCVGGGGGGGGGGGTP